MVTDAANKALPDLAMVWHDSPYDEHPTADVTQGQEKIWQAVAAVVSAGLSDATLLMLTWDDPTTSRGVHPAPPVDEFRSRCGSQEQRSLAILEPESVTGSGSAV